jgi:hypothetical protein
MVLTKKKESDPVEIYATVEAICRIIPSAKTFYTPFTLIYPD